MSPFVLLADPATFAVVAGLFGLIIGSFLNVVIHRLPTMMERDWAMQCAELRNEALPTFDPLTLSKPRSRCPKCGHGITALENIPVLSWLVLRGRCSACRNPISPRYPAVELITGGIFSALALHYDFGLAAIAAMGFAAALIALTGIDFDTQLLPDDITLPLLWAGLLINIPGTFTTLKSAVIGAIAGYLALWAVYWGFKLATGKEGMGYGDFKLLAALGAWLGWEMLPLTILLSSFVGALIGLSLIVFARQGRNVPIPFGPYLAIAGMIALIWGKPLTQAYLGTRL
ncbi:MAG: prepilin peptidase [Rhodocyclaceae bacterium]|jgi:leader peptidase (prepilin peptidase)/N-methyltransferase|nr:prepilin peptidase [Rhodocyclaceae bacterium]MBK6908172.1 prepilin peptidase [Rhodocyclaceae bacterium]